LADLGQSDKKPLLNKPPMKEPKDSDRSEEKSVFQIIYDLFRSLKLTIFILILLAILSIIGTLITQNATTAEYVQRYGARLYELLNFFNIFDMYHSWWFSVILLLLVINLIACSLNRFPGVWSQIFRGPGSDELDDSKLKTLPYIERIKITGDSKASKIEEIKSLLKKGFANSKLNETESAVTLFSEKGRFSRLGVYITHLSILIILIGGLLGSLGGFRGHVEILEGETVNQISLRSKDREIAKPIDFSIRCDDFKVTFYDIPGREKHVKEYTSILTLLENGKEVLKQTVQVNHPLHYKGLAFYQANYGAIHEITIGVQWKGKPERTLLRTMEGDTVPVPNSDAFIHVLRYTPQVHNSGEGVQVGLLRPNRQPQVFWLLKDNQKLDEKRSDDVILAFEGVATREYTGLQVTKDPGVWVVWAGCAMMVIGLIVSFFYSHQRIWIRIPKTPGKEVVLAGSANKNKVGFEKTFGQLAEKVRSWVK
jgi:cytochrome c biogenesis protein